MIPYSMLHGTNNTHNTEDCYTLKNIVKGTKNRKQGSQTEKSKRSMEMNVLMTYVKKRVAFKNNQNDEAKAARAEGLNNSKNMSLDNFQPKDGKIERNE